MHKFSCTPNFHVLWHSPCYFHIRSYQSEKDSTSSIRNLSYLKNICFLFEKYKLNRSIPFIVRIGSVQALHWH